MGTLAAIVGSTTVTLNNGSPFSLLSARGMAGPPVRRITQQGPSQDGDTDLGYRLGPRNIELVIGFSATTDALLDGYRDTLTGIFKPLSSTPIKLRWTRDDTEVRQIDCYTVGNVKIDLIPEHRPGHYHRATVRLYAPEATWYGPTAGSGSVVGTAYTAGSWWLAGGAIGSAQVKEYGTFPTQGQVWTYSGTPTDPYTAYLAGSTGGYTIAVRGTAEPITDGKFMFFAGSASGTPAVSVSTSGTTHYLLGANSPDGGFYLGTIMPASGTHNYYTRWYYYSIEPTNVAAVERNRDFGWGTINVNYNMSGTARRWRSNATNTAASRWTSDIERYAVFVPALTNSQLEALDTYMSLGTTSTDGSNLAVAYGGDMPDYPTLSIRGPISSPSVTNVSTGHVLDFGTITIGAGTTYVINTHPLYKSVLAGTVSKIGELSADSDLGEFHLGPAPAVTGGTNVLLLSGTAMGTATLLSITYYNRFLSF